MNKKKKYVYLNEIKDKRKNRNDCRNDVEIYK